MQNMSSEELYRLVGKNVAYYRKQKNISQLELSLLMGYKSISIVSSSEVYYKNKHFNLEHLLKISQILQIDLCDFFKERNPN